MSMQQSIKYAIQALTKGISQIPLDKQSLVANRVRNIIDKYENQPGESHLPNFLKQLEFNLSFIRMSFPKVSFTPDPEEVQGQEEEGKEKEEDKQTKSQTQSNEEAPKSEKKKHIHFQLENQQKLDEMAKNVAKQMNKIRQEVNFTNWAAGNQDPQLINRHKALLERQYFAGDFWKDKQIPISGAAVQLQNAMQDPQRRHKQVILDDDQGEKKFAFDPESRWDKIKR